MASATNSAIGVIKPDYRTAPPTDFEKQPQRVWQSAVHHLMRLWRSQDINRWRRWNVTRVKRRGER